MENNNIEKVAQSAGVPYNITKSVIEMLDQGATIPFIARYRKERTNSLDEVGILLIEKEKKNLETIVSRKESIIKVIEEQGKLTDQLRAKINDCWDATILEDLYLPYKPKKTSRATKARELGLEPLAKEIMTQRNPNLLQSVGRYVKGAVYTEEQAIAGAKDIIAEWISENEKTRADVRLAFERGAMINAKVVKSKALEAIKYRDYFDYSEKLSKCPSHRMLAIRRGEEEGLLRVAIRPEQDPIIDRLKNYYVRGNGDSSRMVSDAVEDSYKRLIEPSIESEFRKSAKEKADEEAIKVFVDNLKQLLLAAPLGEKRIMAIDPGFRTGCKVVCLDENGTLLYNTTIFPHPPQNQRIEAANRVLELISRYKMEAVAIGNGTAGRESLEFINEIITDDFVKIYMVNEAGASIYSASEIARQEFPDHDITVRGAVSIGRRLMDPLAELVKLDPKSIGVGQYQHDVNQVLLKESLTNTVEYCVNSIGINLNTASPSLLTYVSGLGPVIAQNIVEYRSKVGAFKERKEVLKVPRMGAKAYEQCAGFLRIRNAVHPLDNTGVHPERYALVSQMAKDVGVSIEQLIENEALIKQIDMKRYLSDDVGLPTLKDIVKELGKPGLDPRGDVQATEFNKSVKTIDDLEVGMILNGVVTNITNFGAFVDVGIKGDGLVHISQITDRFIKSPSEVLSLGQSVKVKVYDLDKSRARVNLSMKNVN